MSASETKPYLQDRLFVTFSSNLECNLSSPINNLMLDDNASTQKFFHGSVRTSDTFTSSNKRSVRTQQSQEVEEELADFKKYLHKSTLLQREQLQRVDRPKSKCQVDRQALKNRLQQKMLLAQEKLDQIKITLDRHKLQKEEIVRNSDKRRPSHNSKPPISAPMLLK